ncbi:peptidase domain-containing ABC transporter [Chroococcidiopsis sp. FACHB-1243]|uniref:type I secretion system permease/ATPase n=1 Tax=Chroococcidiopsis sp. [FACHB-1243] TaxID=2692781 RepID=UPI00177DE3C3|nr:peptidase domain-containing ABC transporter [Chroococcidiopsis sp. [FACHB-1243]]
MTATISSSQFQAFLAQTNLFHPLPATTLQELATKCQLWRYRIGQPLLVREKMPTQVLVIYQGTARLIGYDRRQQSPVSLGLVEPKTVLGWAGLIRNIPCETAIASTEVICIAIPAADFLASLSAEPTFAQHIKAQFSHAELCELLSLELQRRADSATKLKDLVFQLSPSVEVLNLAPGQADGTRLRGDRTWLISSGAEAIVGNRFELNGSAPTITEPGVRLLGVKLPQEIERTMPVVLAPTDLEVPYAPEQPPVAPATNTKSVKYPFVRGQGEIGASMACFQMLCQYLGVSWRRDTVRRVLENQQKSLGTISLQSCGAIAEMLGMSAQLIQVPSKAIARIKTPALIRYHDSLAILYACDDKELTLAVPEIGIHRQTPADFARAWGEGGQVLLLQARPGETTERFSLRWFLPAIAHHRGVLIEVLIASFFVQLFGLANPLVTQVIIDQVLVNGALDTLNVLGILLLGVALFEALLTGVRTYLFVDTTNRIDIALGSEVIDRLLRLPLSYFDRRRVGELASRINELENIRQFLTGTALTVVLDAVFSVIYIAVMLFYSWILTLVALATVPVFALLTIFVAPIVRKQLRVKAERYADTQSYLVEVVSGIQTVKAQNIELKSRWHWHERYARYISAGFNTVVTSTTASSVSGFFNKFSGLLLLWVGAYLVISQQLTLGQLIAFRIISSYTTSPLLRLIQLWQNFQETALSIERLGDILDAHPEVDEANRAQLPMPEIEGAVKFDGVSFRFGNSGVFQLTNVNLEFPAGTFVGIVGQSGSGKSTLTKLLPRLYEPTTGTIQIDNYDISKVELYSLRRQIGMVLQDTLLFNGTVQENIALTNPEASSEQIIAAAKIAVAHDFIMSLPNGYNTNVGERGSALSGGQRQRIAIARTVLQNPKLLILDEATSALDYDSERQVCQNLAEAFHSRTVFFITHRLATVKNADAILVMDKGVVVEQGTHQQLMALRGRYFCLYQQQESQL